LCSTYPDYLFERKKRNPESYSVNIITASLDIMALGKVYVIVQILEIPQKSKLRIGFCAGL
jgi:hypothetical protein